MTVMKVDQLTDNGFKKKLYAINLPKFEKQASVSYLRTEELKCVTVDNGIILPLRKTDIPALDAIYEGGVCDESFKFIAGHIRYNNGKYNNLETVRSYKSNDVGYLDEEVVYMGTAFHHFGHFLLESLNRLWWIVKNRMFDIKVVFLKNKIFESPFLELLELVGIKKENIVFLESPTKFRSVIIPDQSLCFFDSYHQELVLPYEEMLKKITPSNYGKIYLSRTQFRKKDCINEEYFEEFYREMGYKIIYPEQLNIKEQISLVSGADEIVSTIGTISHLALFAKKGARITSLLRSRTAFSTAQTIINQSKELNYTFVDVTCNFLPHRYSANCYYIGPNVTWRDFVKQEYGLELNIDLFDYLNSEHSHMGDYFKQWIKTFSNKNQLKKIQKDTSLDILNNLEVVFADQAVDFKTKSEKLVKDLIESPNKQSQFSEKTFHFSRYDGTYAREIHLSKSGVVKTINGKGHKNESFWQIENDELIFLNSEGKLTSRYFCVKEKESGLFLLGYYQPNKEIIFRLEEIKTTGLRVAKQN